MNSTVSYWTFWLDNRGKMNCFDIRAAYNGRTLIMPSDTDHIVFVNNSDIKWDDGSSVTTDDMVSFLKIYGQDQLKPKEERQFRYKIWFVDGQGASYGDSILFNENGEPVLKIENGIIRSSRIKCGCETRFPAAGLSAVSCQQDPVWLRRLSYEPFCRENILPGIWQYPPGFFSRYF